MARRRNKQHKPSEPPPEAPRQTGRLQRILTGGLPEPEPQPEKHTLLGETRQIVRRRIIAGILFLIPIATTVWFLSFFLQIIYGNIEPLIRPLLVSWHIDPKSFWYKAVGLAMSIFVVLAFLYLIGLFLSRTAVRRLIELAEALVVRIPFVKFFYRTSKQIVETVSLPKGSLNKVVVIEFFRPNMKTIGFATGETLDEEGRMLVNVFIPKTPNPTSGFIVLLPPHEVRETDLAMEQALAFVISGGILSLHQIETRPYEPRVAMASDSGDHKAAAKVRVAGAP